MLIWEPNERGDLVLKTKKMCAEPGCDVQLGPRTYSGVCRDHMHGPNCKCEMCGGVRPETRVRELQRTAQRKNTGAPDMRLRESKVDPVTLVTLAPIPAFLTKPVTT
jgi:hypothetical protein